MSKRKTLKNQQHKNVQNSTRDVVANVLDSGLEVNEFELQSRYYVHLRINKLWNPLFCPHRNSVIVVQRGWIWH